MNWDQIAGNWQQFRGKVRARWAKLTDDDVGQIDARREELVGKIQELYNTGKEEAERQISEWLDTQSEPQSPSGADTEDDQTVRERAAGRAWLGIEGGVDAVCAHVRAQPLTSVALAIGTGLALGILLARR